MMAQTVGRAGSIWLLASLGSSHSRALTSTRARPLARRLPSTVLGKLFEIFRVNGQVHSAVPQPEQPTLVESSRTARRSFRDRFGDLEGSPAGCPQLPEWNAIWRPFVYVS